MFKNIVLTEYKGFLAQSKIDLSNEMDDDLNYLSFLQDAIEKLEQQISIFELLPGSMFKEPDLKGNSRIHKIRDDFFILEDINRLSDYTHIDKIYEVCYSIAEQYGISLTNAAVVKFASRNLTLIEPDIDAYKAFVSFYSGEKKKENKIKLDELEMQKESLKKYILVASGRKSFISDQVFKEMYLDRLSIFSGLREDFDTFLKNQKEVDSLRFINEENKRLIDLFWKEEIDFLEFVK